MADGDGIRFLATVYKVQTLVDGGVRVTLDLPETAIMQMAQLAECQRFGVVLEFSAEPDSRQATGERRKRTVRQGTERKPEGTLEERA